MCKLSGWSAVPDRVLEKSIADCGLLAAHEVISKTETDGFGFAQPGKTGLRGRFRSPSGFKGVEALPSLRQNAGAAIKAFYAPKHSLQSGTYDGAHPMVIHGRTATSAVSLPNVHPFRYKGWTLAHNGVVTWNGPDTNGHELVTCDSQHILLCLVEGGDVKASMEQLTGYAAFIAFSPKGEMIVARDNRAALYAAVLSNGRWIFGTTAEIAENVASYFTKREVQAFLLDNNTWLEFPVGGGEPAVSSWKIGEATAKENWFATRSLGELGKDDTEETEETEYVEETVSETNNSTLFLNHVKLGEIRYFSDSAGVQFAPPSRAGVLHTDLNKAEWVSLGASCSDGWTCTKPPVARLSAP